MEAEYISLTEGVKQLVWMQWLLQDLGIDQKQPMSIHSDNLCAIMTLMM